MFRGSGRPIPRVPGGRRDREQRAKNRAVQGGEKHVRDRGAVPRAAVAAVDHPPPEERSGQQKRQMLERVKALARQCRFEERRQVPDPERDAVQDEHHHRCGEHPPAPRDRRRAEACDGGSPARRGNGPEKGQQRLSDHEQRRSHEHQDLVLRHVRAHQYLSPRVKR